MRLKRVEIENFRGIRSAAIDIDDTTVLIGENNSGKTTVLEAIRICMSRSFARRANPFEDEDYLLLSATSRPGDAGAIRIRLFFAELSANEWSPDLLGALADVVVVGSTGLNQMTFEVTSRFDIPLNDYVADWNFLDVNGRALVRAKRPANLAVVQNLFNVFYLTASRDAARDFGPRSPFWGPFLRNPAIPDQIKTQLEQELATLNSKILQADTRLQNVSVNLGKAQEVVSLGRTDTVTIDAIPSQIWDLLSRAQVNVAAITGAALPLARHGAGTQSLASIFLFEAFLRSGLGKTDPLASSLLEVEEPEAHLHPSAVRALWPALASAPGQKVIATHSGDLLSEVPLDAIRRFRRTPNGLEVKRYVPGTLNARDLRKVQFHVRQTRGELFFARVWLLHEGETDFWLLSEAARLAGLKFEQMGVRLVEYAKVGIETMIKLADEFGISWHCMFDGDPEGQKNAGLAASQLSGRAAAEHLSIVPAKDVEHYLCSAGFGDVYAQNIDVNKARIVVASPGTSEYWDQVIDAQPKRFKTSCILEVISQMEARGAASIPPFVLQVLNAAIQLGRV